MKLFKTYVFFCIELTSGGPRGALFQRKIDKPLHKMKLFKTYMFFCIEITWGDPRGREWQEAQQEEEWLEEEALPTLNGQSDEVLWDISYLIR